MKKQVLVSVMTLLTTFSAMAASSLSNGDYTGHTRDGGNCGLRIKPNEALNGRTTIQFTWTKNGKNEYGYVDVKNDEIRIDSNTFSAQSSNDIAKAKVKLTLANDGTPIEAKMGVGLFVQIGYDATCLQLTRK
jgi:hypothetical protein